MIVWLLMALTAILAALAIWLWRTRRPSLAETTKAGLDDLLAQLKGRVDALAAEKDLRTQDVQRERDAYKDLTQQWNERVETIRASLTTLDQQAVTTVSEMTNTLKPIISIFRSPQAAGIEFGEAALEMLLKTHLGEGLYTRKPRHLAVGQEVVDFALTLPDCVVPIDSKFPSSTYKTWVEATTEQEARAAWRTFRDAMLVQMEATAKYIKPDAGTTDYALLFVPSDVIYQQAFLAQRIDDQENPIPQRSLTLQVFGCSTQTLMPYLGLIRLGLRNLKISEDVKGIRRLIEQLDVVFKTFSGDWDILRGHVDRLTKHVDRLSTGRGSVAQLGEAVKKLAGPEQGSGPEPLAALHAEPDMVVELERRTE